jgi:hypothetical protein
MECRPDGVFAAVEVVLVVGGCFAGLEGCATGYVLSFELYNSGPNMWILVLAFYLQQ